MLYAAARTKGVVTRAILRPGIDSDGGRIVVTTNVTGGTPIEIPKSLFELWARNLRPPAEFRKYSFDFDDGHRVVKWLKHKRVIVRRTVTNNGVFVDSILGVTEDEELPKL